LIIFDEKKHAETMLREGFTTKNRIVTEMKILSKYFFSKGFDDTDVKDKLVAFCEKHQDYFNNAEWYKIINKTLGIAKKSKLVTGREVKITQAELDTITSLPSLNEQRLAFVLLVLYKFYNKRKFQISLVDLFSLCKISVNSKTKMKLPHSLTSKGLIDINLYGKRWVNFVNDDSEVVIHIRKFDDLIYYYLNYIGEGKYKYCCICDGIFYLSNNRQTKCRQCAKESWRQYNAQKQLEYRKR
jgi:hypothetical protein